MKAAQQAQAGNQPEAPAAAELRRLGEFVQSLSGAPGSKALLRRFGELMKQGFAVRRMEFARFTGQGPSLTLKRRGVQVDGLEEFSAGEFDQLQAALQAAGLTHAHLKDGVTHFSVADRMLSLASIDDPRTKKGCLVAWEPTPASSTGLGAIVVDQAVRHVQNESRWFRKLDKTQALLNRDDLTGLYNSRYLEIALDAELRRADRFQNQFCLLFIDLDGFKPINDQHGHLSGSSVLRQVADVIRDAVREIDVPIRYGGDEFVVLLLGATCSKGQLVAERVRRRIEQASFRLEDGGAARVTASIGVAAYPDHGKDRSTLLRMADETMYDSKRAGKNRVTVVGQRQSVS